MTIADRPNHRPVSRRRFLGGSAAVGAGLLAGCSSGTIRPSSEPTTNPLLVIRSWTDYIDPDEDGYIGTLTRFASQAGISVEYIEEYEDNAAELAETFAPLGAGQTIGPDIVVPTNWVAARLVDRGWVEPLDIAALPNHKNLDPTFLTPTWDRGAQFNMPWQVGITGIAYNPELTGRIVGGHDYAGCTSAAGRPGDDKSTGGHGTHVAGIMAGAGVVAGLSGTSGGYLKTPISSGVLGIPLRVAAATTTFTAGVTASVGLIVFALQGRVDPRAAAAVIAGSLIGGRLGATQQARVSASTVRLVVVVALMVVFAVLWVRA